MAWRGPGSRHLLLNSVEMLGFETSRNWKSWAVLSQKDPRQGNMQLNRLKNSTGNQDSCVLHMAWNCHCIVCRFHPRM